MFFIDISIINNVSICGYNASLRIIIPTKVTITTIIQTTTINIHTLTFTRANTTYTPSSNIS